MRSVVSHVLLSLQRLAYTGQPESHAAAVFKLSIYGVLGEVYGESLAFTL